MKDMKILLESKFSLFRKIKRFLLVGNKNRADYATREMLKGKENTPKMLDKNEQIELEVYRHVRYSPFFQHHLTNNLKYFSERMVETSLAMKNLTVPGQVLLITYHIFLSFSFLAEQRLFELH